VPVTKSFKRITWERRKRHYEKHSGSLPMERKEKRAAAIAEKEVSILGREKREGVAT